MTTFFAPMGSFTSFPLTQQFANCGDLIHLPIDTGAQLLAAPQAQTQADTDTPAVHPAVIARQLAKIERGHDVRISIGLSSQPTSYRFAPDSRQMMSGVADQTSGVTTDPRLDLDTWDFFCDEELLRSTLEDMLSDKLSCFLVINSEGQPSFQRYYTANDTHVASISWDTDHGRWSFFVIRGDGWATIDQSGTETSATRIPPESQLSELRPEKSHLTLTDRIICTYRDSQGTLHTVMQTLSAFPCEDLCEIPVPDDSVTIPVLDPRLSETELKEQIRASLVRASEILSYHGLRPVRAEIVFALIDYDDLVDAGFIEPLNTELSGPALRKAKKEAADKWNREKLESLRNAATQILQDFPHLACLEMFSTTSFDEDADVWEISLRDMRKNRSCRLINDGIIESPYYTQGQLDPSTLSSYSSPWEETEDLLEDKITPDELKQQQAEEHAKVEASDHEPTPITPFPREQYRSLIREGVGGVSDVEETLDMLATLGEPWQTVVTNFRKLVAERGGDDPFPLVVEKTAEPATFCMRGIGSIRTELADRASFNLGVSFLAVVHEILAHALPIGLRHPEVAAIPYLNLDDLRAQGNIPTLEEIYVLSLKEMYADEAMATLSEAIAYRDLLNAGVPKEWFLPNEAAFFEKVLVVYQRGGIPGYLRSELYIGRNHRSSYTRKRAMELAIEAAQNADILADLTASAVARHMGLDVSMPGFDPKRLTAALHNLADNPHQARAQIQGLILAARQSGTTVNIDITRLTKLVEEHRALVLGTQDKASHTFLGVRKKTVLRVQVLGQARRQFSRYRKYFEEAWNKANGVAKDVQLQNYEDLITFYKLAVMQQQNAEPAERASLSNLVTQVYAVLTAKTIDPEILYMVTQRLTGDWSAYEEGMRKLAETIPDNSNKDPNKKPEINLLDIFNRQNLLLLISELKDPEVRTRLTKNGTIALIISNFFHHYGFFVTHATLSTSSTNSKHKINIYEHDPSHPDAREESSPYPYGFASLFMSFWETLVASDASCTIQTIIDSRRTIDAGIRDAKEMLSLVALSMAVWGCKIKDTQLLAVPAIRWHALRSRGYSYVSHHYSGYLEPDSTEVDLMHSNLEENADTHLSSAYFFPSTLLPALPLETGSRVYSLGNSHGANAVHHIEASLEVLERRAQRRSLEEQDISELSEIIMTALTHSQLTSLDKLTKDVNIHRKTTLYITQQSIQFARLLARHVSLEDAREFLNQCLKNWFISDPAMAFCQQLLTAEMVFIPFFAQITTEEKKQTLATITQEYATAVDLSRAGMDPFAVASFVSTFSNDPELSDSVITLLQLAITHTGKYAPQSRQFLAAVEILVPVIHKAWLSNQDKDNLLSLLFESVSTRLDRTLATLAIRDRMALMNWLEGFFFSDQTLAIISTYQNTEQLVFKQARELLTQFGNMPLTPDLQGRVMKVCARLEQYIQRTHPEITTPEHLDQLITISSDPHYRVALADVFPSQRAQVDMALPIDQWDEVSIRRGLIDYTVAWPRVEQALTAYLEGTFTGDVARLLTVYSAFVDRAIEVSGRPTLTTNKAMSAWLAFNERKKKMGTSTAKKASSLALETFVTATQLLSSSERLLLTQLTSIPAVKAVLDNLPTDETPLTQEQKNLLTHLLQAKTITDAQRKKELFIIILGNKRFPTEVRRQAALGLILCSRFGSMFESLINAYVAAEDEPGENTLYDMVSLYWERVGQLPDNTGIILLNKQRNNPDFWEEFDQIFQAKHLSPDLITSPEALEILSLRYGQFAEQFMKEVGMFTDGQQRNPQNLLESFVYKDDISQLIPLDRREEIRRHYETAQVHLIERTENLQLIQLGMPHSILSMPASIRFIALRLVAHLPKEFGVSLIKETREIEAEQGRAKALCYFFERTGLIKVGQALSTLYGVIPDKERAIYARLQDSTPPSSPSEVERTVATALGQPRESVFSFWDPLPVGSASMGEVYRAILRETGEEVFVKVSPDSKYEQNDAGIKALQEVAQDFEEAIKLGRFQDTGINFPAMIRRIVMDLRFQMDFTREATNNRELAGLHYRVPQIITKHSSQRVLVMKPAQGQPLKQLASIPERERLHAARQIGLQAMKMLFRDHVYHKDPHPGNLFYDPQTQALTWIDLGVIAHINTQKAAQLLHFLLMLGLKRQDNIVKAFMALTTKESREHSFDRELFDESMSAFDASRPLGEQITMLIEHAGKAGLYLDPSIMDALHFLLVVNSTVLALDPRHNLAMDLMSIFNK